MTLYKYLLSLIFNVKDPLKRGNGEFSNTQFFLDLRKGADINIQYFGNITTMCMESKKRRKIWKLAAQVLTPKILCQVIISVSSHHSSEKITKTHDMQVDGIILIYNSMIKVTVTAAPVHYSHHHSSPWTDCGQDLPSSLMLTIIYLAT